MRDIRRDLHRQLPILLLAGLWAIGPAGLLYLLVLQLPFTSTLRIGLAAFSLPLFAVLAWWLLERDAVVARKVWLPAGLAATCLALLAVQALSFYPEKTYLFYGRHTLVLTVQAGDAFELRGFKTSLGSVSYSAFERLDGWERRGNKLVPVVSPPPVLTWSGWTGDSARLDAWGPAGTVIEARWDGRGEELKIGEQGNAASVFAQSFGMPEWGRGLLFLLCAWALFYGISMLALLAVENGETLSAAPWLRGLFLATVIAGLGLHLLGIYLEIHPAREFPSRDSGVFLYAGRQILEGKVPYRDIWDHKGPLIFYLNALGLWLGKDSAEGVWALELAWLTITISTLFLLLRKIGGLIPAAAGCLIFLLGLGESLAGGNFAEEYVLLFQVLALAAFWKYLGSRKAAWMMLAGLATGCAFLIRPNQISVGLGIGLYLCVLAWRNQFSGVSLRGLLFLGAGWMAPPLLFTLFLVSQGALAQALSAVFIFNRIYVGPLRLDLLRGFTQGLYSFPLLGFWIVAGLAALSALLIRRESSPQHHFGIVLALSGSAELVLSNLSGAGFKHYYITWLPYVACLVAYLCAAIIDLAARLFARLPRALPWLLYVGATLLALPAVWSISSGLFARDYPLDWMRRPPAWESRGSPVGQLSGLLPHGSKLLMWGSEASYNFVLHADAPARFVYQYPLMTPEYVTPGMIVELVSGIAAQGTVIVDASAGNPYALPLEPARRGEFLAQPGNTERYAYLQPFFEYFDIHYRPVKTISRDWIVYRPMP